MRDLREFLLNLDKTRRPCEDTITLTAEWENYPAREGGKTTKGEGGFATLGEDVDEKDNIFLFDRT